MKTRYFLLPLLALILAACAPATPVVPTPDVLAVRTSAAYTVVAEITLTAAAFTSTPLPPSATSTPEPPPTATPTEVFTTDPTQAALGTPASLCDNYVYVADVTIVDGTAMTAGQDFVKTWKIKNTGDCTWGDGYGLIYSYGEKMSGEAVPFGTVVAPGQEIDVSVNFKAPDKIGEYVSSWQMANPQGLSFGSKENILFVKIVVK
jgi:Ig-like domain from next to BRCA1 gene